MCYSQSLKISPEYMEQKAIRHIKETHPVRNKREFDKYWSFRGIFRGAKGVNDALFDLKRHCSFVHDRNHWLAEGGKIAGSRGYPRSGRCDKEENLELPECSK